MSRYITFQGLMMIMMLILGAAALTVFITTMIVKGSSSGSTEDEDEEDDEEEDVPRQVNDREGEFLPQILGDFPDFDISAAKAAAASRIAEETEYMTDLNIHATAISDYIRTEKKIVFQCAFGYCDDGDREQALYELSYVPSGSVSIPYKGSNCPSCGAPIGKAAATVCEYCGCRLATTTGTVWRFTDVEEI